MDIGFIGLGNMGYPMGRRSIEAGHRLVVFDTSGQMISRLRALLSTSEFGADKDFTTVVQCVERWAGVEVRAKKSG